jgi:hypothetical protein
VGEDVVERLDLLLAEALDPVELLLELSLPFNLDVRVVP